jgi:hypothetical protein
MGEHELYFSFGKQIFCTFVDFGILRQEYGYTNFKGSVYTKMGQWYK